MSIVNSNQSSINENNNSFTVLSLNILNPRPISNFELSKRHNLVTLMSAINVT